MARLRAWLSGFLVLALLLTAAPVFAEGTGADGDGGPAAIEQTTEQPADPSTEPATDPSIDPNGPAALQTESDIEPVADSIDGYVRIKNKWQNNYLYESSNGIVRYGLTAPSDESSHWQLEDDTDGAKRIKNRRTGHYITIGDVKQRRDALTTADASGPDTRWLIEPASRAGYSLIKSATVPSASNLVIHEEDQLGFAEASTDINVTFESPQWKLIPVSDPVPVLIRNQDRAGQYLYVKGNPEAPTRPNDVVAFGKVDLGDAHAQWLLEQGEDGKVKLRNAATGQYIVQAEDWRALETNVPDNVADPAALEWDMGESIDGAGSPVVGYVTFKSATDSTFVLNSQFPGDANARSNSWSNETLANAHWRIEPVGEKPVRIVNFTEGDVGTDYLFEENGVVKHGALGTANAYNPVYQWVIEDYDGAKRIRNAATGHYATAGVPLTAQSAGASDGADQWRIQASAQYDDYMTIENAANAGEYLSLVEGDANAQSAAVDPNSNGAQWLLEDPSVPVDGTAQYVRIQNVWQPYVLYEDDNGDLKYGNPRTDRRDQWLIQKYHGRKRIQNRATGHYVNLESMKNGRIRVTEVQDDWTSAIWVIETVGGSKLIRSVNDPATGGDTDRLINLQNLTKYAEYAVINRGWSSPRWTFLPVSDDLPAFARLINKQTGKALYEEANAENGETGLVKYGEKPATDASSVWGLEDAGDGTLRLRNSATGNYVAMENVGADVELPDPPEPLQTLKTIYPSWGSAKWVLENASDEGYVAFRSAWASHYIKAEDDGGAVKVSKSVKAEDGKLAPSAEFKLEAADAAVPQWPTGYIQIRSSLNGQYLYENASSVVLYGDVDASNGYSHWILETTDGKTRVKNRVTGHYLAVNGDYRYVESVAASASNPAAQWALEAAADGASVRIRSLDGSMNDEYIHVNSSAGYAERGLLPVSYGSLSWQFVAAPAQFEKPSDGGIRNDQTSTPTQDDSRYVEISFGSKKLSETNGSIVLTESETGDAASEWLLQDFNGRKLIKNKASGRLLVLDADGDLIAATGTAKILNEAQWTIEENLGYRTVRNAASPALYLTHTATAVKLAAKSSADAVRWSFNPVTADVVYEAEDAFASGEVTNSNVVTGYSGIGYAEGFSTAGDKLVWAVNAQSAGQYDTSIRYVNGEADAKSLNVYVNGLFVQALSLPSASEWTNAELALQLRSGINSITLELDSAGAGEVSIDSITVNDSVNKAARGATLPYTTYEAEQGTTNGTLIGPSRVYREVASEASGRQAVKLSETGQYVEFKTAKDANSIVLRYSIPDSEDGEGLTETLGLYVNGQFRKKLELTSKYAWEYGSYPWSNDPNQGSAHRFFDEMHALVEDVPAGATIRLMKDADSNADYYIVDLADLEQVADPLAKPQGFVSVTDYGAAANDGQDDTASFKQAMAAAQEAHTGVWFPAGQFELGDGLLYLDQVTIRGAGMWYTQLNGAKFVGKGSNIQVYDLLIDGGINVRDDEAITNAFHGGFGPGSVIQNVWIEHTKAGLWLTKLKESDEYTHGLYMAGLRIRDLMADGINFCVGTTGSMMEQSDVRYPGDDGIAIWSAEGRASIDNVARFNNVSLPWLADNIVVFGGIGNKVQDNIVSDTITNGAGIAVSTRFNPVPFGGTTIVERNTMIRTGSYDTGYQRDLGALWVFASDKDMDGEIIIRDNVALDSTYLGIAVQGDFSLQDVLLKNIVVDGAGTQGIEMSSTVKGGLKIDNVIIRGARIADVSNASSLAVSELGRGFSSSKLPFVLQAGDSAAALTSLSVVPGSKTVLKVIDSSEENVVSQASLAVLDDEVASIGADGTLTAKKRGATYLLVTLGDETRGYRVTVASAPSSGGPGGGSQPESESGTDANDRLLIESKESTVVFDAGAPGLNGSFRFSVAGLQAAFAAHPQGVIEVRNGSATYTLPLSVIAKLLEGRTIANPEEAIWSIIVRPADADKAAAAKKAASDQGIELAGDPVEFSIQLTENGVAQEIGGFGTTFVTRMIAVDGEWPASGSAVLVFDPANGSFRFVPATFSSAGGKTTATIRSTTNSLYVVAKHQRTYSDIASHWAKEDIDLLASKLIIKGISDEQFAPNRPITRAEFSSLLVRALGLRHQDGASGRSFSDVAAGSWYAKDVSVAAEYGIVQGMADGSFHPGDSITREQMAVMIARVVELAKGERLPPAADQALAKFKDRDGISDWAQAATAQATTAGIVQGTADGRFEPSAQASRAEAATILKRMLQYAGLID